MTRGGRPAGGARLVRARIAATRARGRARRARYAAVAVLLAVASLVNAVAARADADPANTYPAVARFDGLAHACAPNVDPSTLAALVRTESGFNPFAIGIVGAHLQRQPASLAEALATVRELDARGFSYSVGLTQVNNRNFDKYGETAATLFEPCRNLRAGAAILTECFARSSSAPVSQQAALRAALSCYYSGNFTTGFRAGYVGKVVRNARLDALQGGVRPIPVVRDAAAAPADAADYDAGLARTTVAVSPSALASNASNAVRPVGDSVRGPFVKPVSSVRHGGASCAAHPLVTVCHGLSAAQIRSLCVRCLDVR